MNRRGFIAGAAVLAVALPSRAQQRAMPVIGILGLTTLATGNVAANIDAFRAGLKETGYIDGQNVRIEFLWADQQAERLPGMAADMVARKVDVIVTEGSDATTLAAKNATSTIPIVYHGTNDPVALGWVASFARPGGNLTGINQMGGELIPKLLELLLEVVPYAKLIGLLQTPASTMSLPAQSAQRVKLLTIEALGPTEVDSALASLVRERADGIIVYTLNRARIAAAALRERVPTIALYRDFTDAGGLLCYGPSMTDAYRWKGRYTGRILNGEKPAELPIMQPTKLELIVNLKTAKALGLSVPHSLMQRADEVIE